MKQGSPREDTIHRGVVAFLNVVLKPDVIWFHVPNGEKRDLITGARLKALGTRKGVPDLVFVLPGGRAAFIELKRSKKAPIGPNQKQFKIDCERAGALHAITTSIDETLATLDAWGALRIPANTLAAAGREGGAGLDQVSASGPGSCPSEIKARVSGVPG